MVRNKSVSCLKAVILQTKRHSYVIYRNEYLFLDW